MKAIQIKFKIYLRIISTTLKKSSHISSDLVLTLKHMILKLPHKYQFHRKIKQIKFKHAVNYKELYTTVLYTQPGVPKVI